jgi:hypothetical protein
MLGTENSILQTLADAQSRQIGGLAISSADQKKIIYMMVASAVFPPGIAYSWALGISDDVK